MDEILLAIGIHKMAYLAAWKGEEQVLRGFTPQARPLSATTATTRLAIAAQILLNLGILIIYIVNLILGQRILRSKHASMYSPSLSRLLYFAP